MSRRSYRGLMLLPTFGLYDDDDKLIATIKANGPDEAERLFNEHGYFGRVAQLVRAADS